MFAYTHVLDFTKEFSLTREIKAALLRGEQVNILIERQNSSLPLIAVFTMPHGAAVCAFQSHSHRREPIEELGKNSERARYLNSLIEREQLMMLIPWKSEFGVVIPF